MNRVSLTVSEFLLWKRAMPPTTNMEHSYQRAFLYVAMSSLTMRLVSTSRILDVAIEWRADAESRRRLQEGGTTNGNSNRAQEKRPCVRRDGDFGRHYNDQFTGFQEIQDQTCSVPAGPIGTNYLYARGGLGNQLHCMAALQRIDPDWRAFDNTARIYLSDEFRRTRVFPTPENVQDPAKLALEKQIHPFPICGALLQSHTPCNCWHVIALKGDACGVQEVQNAADGATLHARTAAAFADLPIKPELKMAAKRFVEEISIMENGERRSIVGVHTRTGALTHIDGIKQGTRRNPRVLVEEAVNATAPYERHGLPFNTVDYEKSRRVLKAPTLATPSFNTSRLLRTVRQEIQELITRHSTLPAILIASDNVRVSQWLSRRLQESTFLTMDAENASMRAALPSGDKFEGRQNLKVVMAQDSKIPSFSNLENDMIELLTLSHADVLVKDNTLRESTYSEAAWWLGGAMAKRVHVPYPNRDLLPNCLKEGKNYT